eukprot:142145_1
MSLDESQSHEGLELVGERPNNISSLLPITKSLSQHKLDIKENEMIEAGHTKPPTVPVPIKHDGDNNTFPNAAKVRPDSGDIVFFNRYILIRLLLTLLTLLMMLLCILYAIGQITTLTIPDFICVNKTIEEIRKHSQEYNLPHGTTSGCWTSKGVKANQDLLFQNRAYKSSWIDVKENPQDIIKCSLFICTALCLLFCFIYCQVFLFIQDVIRFQKQRSTDFNAHSLGGPEDNNISTTSPVDEKDQEDHKPQPRLCNCNCCHNLMNTKIIQCIKRVPSWYKRQFQEDRPGWIIKHFAVESCEIVLQTLALFQYAGVQFHPDKNDNLAEEYQYVLLFGVMIATNAISVGFLWVFYVFWNQSCHGKSFHFSLLIVDSFFDTFYAIFPLILVWDYTVNAGNAIKVGSFYTQDLVSFLRSFVPITLICVKILTASLTVVSKSRTIWKNQLQGLQRSDSIDSDHPGMTNAGMGAQTIELQEKMNVLFDDDLSNVQMFINKASCFRLCVDAGPLLDHSYSHTEVRGLRKGIVSDDHDTSDIQMALSIYDRQQILRRCFIGCFVGLLYITFGVASIVFYQSHFGGVVQYCDDYSADDHLEMRVWDYCTYKVYPIIGFDDVNHIPCQCRSFDIAFGAITQNRNVTAPMVTHIFSHWFMLENIRIIGSSDFGSNINLNFSDDMFASSSMRSIAIPNIRIVSMSGSISNWADKLEFLNLNSTFVADLEYESMIKLNKLKFLDIQRSRVPNIDWICYLRELRYLDLGECPGLVNRSLPSCIWEAPLTKLQVIDIRFVYGSFHEGILGLPSLLSFRAYGADIEYTDFSANTRFKYHSTGTEYDLSQNPICGMYKEQHLQWWRTDVNQVVEAYNPYIIEFLNETDACIDYCDYGSRDYHASAAAAVCPALEYQNGVCNKWCNIPQCGWDGGDCNQLCDFTECEITVGECMQGCNSTHCDYGFEEQCIEQPQSNASVIYNATHCRLYTQCNEKKGSTITEVSESWIGDSICDEYCNNAFCSFDGGDCEQCDSSGLCVAIWSLFIVYANSDGDADYVVSPLEYCGLWPLVEQYDTENKWNCTTSFPIFDLDGNQFLNAYEVQLNVFNKNYPYRVNQVNCSLCAIDVATYYKPWSWNEINEYTTNTTHYQSGSFY